MPRQEYINIDVDYTEDQMNGFAIEIAEAYQEIKNNKETIKTLQDENKQNSKLIDQLLIRRETGFEVQPLLCDVIINESKHTATYKDAKTKKEIKTVSLDTYQKTIEDDLPFTGEAGGGDGSDEENKEAGEE